MKVMILFDFSTVLSGVFDKLLKVYSFFLFLSTVFLQKNEKNTKNAGYRLDILRDRFLFHQVVGQTQNCGSDPTAQTRGEPLMNEIGETDPYKKLPKALLFTAP